MKKETTTTATFYSTKYKPRFQQYFYKVIKHVD
jgi:hypothetical protein